MYQMTPWVTRLLVANIGIYLAPTSVTYSAT